MLFDIKAVSFNYDTPGISGVDCCACLPQSRSDSFSVRCEYVKTRPCLKQVLSSVSWIYCILGRSPDWIKCKSKATMFQGANDFINTREPAICGWHRINCKDAWSLWNTEKILCHLARAGSGGLSQPWVPLGLV